MPSLPLKESDLEFELDAFPLVLVRFPRTFDEHTLHRPTGELERMIAGAGT